MASRALLLMALLAAACVSPPAREAAQLALRDREDVAGMRGHGWALFAGLTQSGWRAWHGLPETFGNGPAPGFRLMEEPEHPGVPLRQASGAPMLSLVLLNPPAFRHIRGERLYSRARLASLNVEGARQIAPFPRDAMAMKTVWAVVHASGTTPISVWDGAGEGAPANWPRTVLVDPAGAAPGAVPLGRFHHLPIAAAELAAVRAIDSSARAGDHLVLLAMHLTTREMPDWIWATFWWHDRPGEGPYAAGRPAALAGAWRNYLMDVAYSMETPREADGSERIAFNPYLEVFPNGRRSNCMACHQGAVWTPAGAAPFLPVTRGPRPAEAPLFRTGTRLDFMWSIATEAR